MNPQLLTVFPILVLEPTQLPFYKIPSTKAPYRTFLSLNHHGSSAPDNHHFATIAPNHPRYQGAATLCCCEHISSATTPPLVISSSTPFKNFDFRAQVGRVKMEEVNLSRQNHSPRLARRWWLNTVRGGRPPVLELTPFHLRVCGSLSQMMSHCSLPRRSELVMSHFGVVRPSTLMADCTPKMEKRWWRERKKRGSFVIWPHF